MSADRVMRRPRRAQAGLSLVELMVGIVVSLLVGLAAAGSAMMFTASQRQGASTSTVSINGLSVINAIKADLSLTGLGFFDDSVAPCGTLNLSSNTNVLSNGAAMAPLAVTRDGDHDQLDVLYATTVESGSSVLLDQVTDGTNAAVRSLLPAAVGQAVMLVPEAAGGLCTVRSVTGVTASTATTPQVLAFADSGEHNQVTFTNPPEYNAKSRATLVGDLTWNRYRVDATSQLVLDRRMDGASAVLLRDVVSFRVQYGVSAAGTPTLDDWVDATGAFGTINAGNIERVRAVRVGVMLRSAQREKAEADGVCRATETAPQLFGFTPSAFTGADTTWRCFRYRTQTVIVPLRNFVM
jgi:type IV pilus assembly protein PilW